MEIVTHILITVLSAYLAFTTALAGGLAHWLGSEIPTKPAETVSTGLTALPSAYSELPRVLIDNAAYQGAAAITAITSGQADSSASPKEALVNIFCRREHGNKVQAVTGTGYIVGSNGVILTNAHIAQFLLLADWRGLTNCVARTGDPAVPTYQVDLLYISPAWIIKNAAQIDSAHPAGTGERDYALLYVTGSIGNAAIPTTLPALALNTQAITPKIVGSTVVTAGYPAETAFAAAGAEAELHPKQATTSLTELMTFGGNQADVMTLAGSVVGEQGASGGPVVSNGKAIGLISTRGDDTEFGHGSLRAITLSYIDRTIKEETGLSLEQNLGGNLPYRAKLFHDTMVPIMKLLLEKEMGN